MKYNQSTLDKVEKLMEESGYIVRYERGTFQSGYCILESRKIIVLNKFLGTEGRINTLADLLPQLEIVYEMLTVDSQRIYDELMKQHAE